VSCTVRRSRDKARSTYWVAATHAAAAIVITMPAFAMSRIEKYPDEYGMIDVGPSLTRMNASDEVNAAGAIVAHGSRCRSVASARRIGMMMLAVTVLLEKSMCSPATASTMTNGRSAPGTAVMLPSRTHASHRAAPVS